MRLFDRLKDFLRGGKSKRKMTYDDLKSHREQDFVVSWNDKFNEAVIHQLREVPEAYRKAWEQEAELSTKKFRRLQEERRKKQEKEAHRND